MRRLRVIFVAGWYPNEDHPLNGIFIQRHARAVSPWCDVGVVYVHQSQHRTKRETIVTVEDGIKTVRIYLPRPPFGNIPLDLAYLNTVNSRLLHALQGIRLLIRELGGVDVIHLHEIRPLGFAAVLGATRHGVPLVTTEHSTEYHDTPPLGLERWKCRYVLGKSSSVLPVSRALERDLKEIAPTANYLIVPNVVDTSTFIPMDMSKTSPVKRLIHISLLNDSQKNVSGLLTAIACLKETRKDFTLHIVGDGPDRIQLEILAKTLDLSDAVIFHGQVTDEDLRVLLKESHIFILNSNYETFGIVGIEALASGVPVISTRCGGPEDYIDDSNGILIDVGDTDLLVSAMDHMLDHWDQYDPLELHEKILNTYSYSAVGEKLFQSYMGVTNGN